MEILVLIQSYLSGEKGYEYGVELYNKLGSSNSLKKLFASGEDDYSREKLRTELETISNSLKPKAPASSYKSFTKPKNEFLDIGNMPEKLREEYANLRPIVNEMRVEHARLPMYSNDQERFEAAKKIVQLSKKRRDIWGRIDHFKAHGKDHPMYQEPVAEEKNPLSELSPVRALYKIKLLRAQRSKLKGNQARFHDYTRICEEIKILEKVLKDDKAAISNK